MVARGRWRPRWRSLKKPRLRGLLAALALLVIAAGIYVAVQLLRPLPEMTMVAVGPPLRVLPGVPPRPAWPGRAEAALGTPRVGLLATHGGSRPVAIASLAKIMTAAIILHDHPLPPSESGPALTVRQADLATYATDVKQGQSVVKVAAGERLSERQALEAMLIPSGNNIAALLARWDAGSQAAFVAKMNAEAGALGLRGTHYADASGADPATVSTAADQFRLTLYALQIPVFRRIVAMPQVKLPVVGVAYNVNYALGHGGINGVKTGSSPQAGGCLAFSAARMVAGRPATIIGVVLRVRATVQQPSELAGVISTSETLLSSVTRSLRNVQVVKPGAVLGQVRAAWGPRPLAVAASGVRVTGWPGMPVRVSVGPRTLPGTVRQGQRLARATVTVGSDVTHVMLIAAAAVPAPSLTWRLTTL